MLKLNKKGIGFTLIYTCIFIMAMIMLYWNLNKFKLTTERATLFQAVDSAARRVAAEVYTNSYNNLEQNGEFIRNDNANIQVAQKHINELNLGKQLKVTSAIFNKMEGKVTVKCEYYYETNYLQFTKGFKKQHYKSKKINIIGIAYIKNSALKQ